MNEQKEQIRVLNIDVLNIRMDQLLERFTSGCLYTLNVDHAILLQSDREFYEAYCAAEYKVLDSQVMNLLWKLRKNSFDTNIAGVDFFSRYCEYHRTNDDVRLFILGGVEDDADIVQGFLNGRYGRMMVTDAHSPSFNILDDPAETDAIIERINRSSANVLVVGLGAPKQEKWIYRNRHRLVTINTYMGVGATFDYLTGRQKRAPRWMQSCGLEWFYRLIQDPGRLAERYLIRDLPFFYYFTLDILNRYQNPFKRQND